MMMMYGCKPTMPVQLVKKEEVPTENPFKENSENVLEAIQAVLAMETLYMKR